MMPVLILSLVLFGACGAAELRTDRERSSVRTAPAKAIVSGIKDTEISFSGRDVWHSWFVRLFTPTNSSNQKLELTLQIRNNELARAQVVLGGDDHSLLSATNSKSGWQSESSGNDRLYISSLAEYAVWPLLLPELPISQPLANKQISGVDYRRWFVSTTTETSSDHDQYILYFDNTGHIRFVEFTMRRLLKGYTGTVEYTDYRTVGELQIPYKVRIKDKPSDKDSVHDIEWDKVELKSSVVAKKEVMAQ